MIFFVAFCVAIADAWVLSPPPGQKPRWTGLKAATLYGDWEPSSEGSYVLMPEEERPKAVVHFIGGAFVGAASQLTYRYLLERLAGDGYVVIATPYRLSFDYMAMCDGIDDSFEKTLAMLDVDVDKENVIGIGHSCGALLHALLATRGATKRRRLAFLSYNNKVATEAVPLFDEVVVPLATEAMTGTTAPFAKRAAETLRGAADVALDVLETSPVQDLASRLGLSQVARQSLELADQVPDLLSELADGAREFDPPPSQVRTLLRTRFSADDALVIQFETDDIDESDDLIAALRDYSSLTTSSKKPRLAFSRLPGTHLTPLTQDIFLPATTVADLARDVPLPGSLPQQENLPAGVTDALTTAATSAADLVTNAAGLVTLPRDQWLAQVDATLNQLTTWLQDDPLDPPIVEPTVEVLPPDDPPPVADP